MLATDMRALDFALTMVSTSEPTTTLPYAYQQTKTKRNICSHQLL